MQKCRWCKIFGVQYLCNTFSKVCDQEPLVQNDFALKMALNVLLKSLKHGGGGGVRVDVNVE